MAMTLINLLPEATASVGLMNVPDLGDGNLGDQQIWNESY